MAANVASLAESIDEERSKYFTSLEVLKGYDKQRVIVMPNQERRYKERGNYNTHIIEPVVTHHVAPKSIKEFVDADGTVIESV